MDAAELMRMGHALQADLLGKDIFPRAIMCDVIVDAFGAVVIKVTLKQYSDDHTWHRKAETAISNYPNEKLSWDEFMDNVSKFYYL